MSDKPSNSEQIENVKRQAGEIVADMKTRNLLLPAIVLAVAIVAALVILPKKSEPVVDAGPPPQPVPAQPVTTKQAIEISLVTPSAIGDDDVLTSSSNPFIGTDDYSCKTISSGKPRVLECMISDLKVRVTCPIEAEGPPCGAPASSEGGGGTGEAGGDTSGGGDTGQPTDQGQTGGTGLPFPTIPTTPTTPVVVYEPRATLRLDEKTHKDVKLGTVLPSKTSPVVTLTGVNEKLTEATFKVPRGSTVTGVTVDKTGLVFRMKPGKTIATITAVNAEVHTLRLDSLKKVRKK